MIAGLYGKSMFTFVRNKLKENKLKMLLRLLREFVLNRLVTVQNINQ